MLTTLFTQSSFYVVTSHQVIKLVFPIIADAAAIIAYSRFNPFFASTLYLTVGGDSDGLGGNTCKSFTAKYPQRTSFDTTKQEDIS